MTHRIVMIALVVLACARGVWADDRYPVTGLVLESDPARLRFVASIETIPGFMTAMTMPFNVQKAADLSGLAPGAIVEFTLVVGPKASYAEGIRIRRFQTVAQDPLAARRLALLKRMASGGPSKALAVGDPVPDFTLTDHKRRPVRFSQLRGKIVAINFTYTTCQLPDFCLRIVNHFGALQKRFAESLGPDLVFLTITFDPARDQPDVLDRYASQWKPNPDVWRFLTGREADVQRVLDWFGVSAFPNEGLIDHALHTVLVGRDGRMITNIEGNTFSTDQLGDLIQSALVKAPTTRGR
jgi:protein SCO1/2